MSEESASRSLDELDRRSILSVCMKLAVAAGGGDRSAGFPRFPVAKVSSTPTLRDEIRRAMEGRPEVAAWVIGETRLRRLTEGR